MAELSVSYEWFSPPARNSGSDVTNADRSASELIAGAVQSVVDEIQARSGRDVLDNVVDGAVVGAACATPPPTANDTATAPPTASADTNERDRYLRRYDTKTSFR